MVKLRLMPLGKRKRPFYRIVATDGRVQSRGQSLGLVGHYDPMNATLNVNTEAALMWLKRGAQMTPTVENLLRSLGILAQFRGLEGSVREDVLTRHKPKRRRKLAQAASAAEEEEATAEEAPAETTAEEAAEEAPAETTAEEAPVEATAEEAPAKEETSTE